MSRSVDDGHNRHVQAASTSIPETLVRRTGFLLSTLGRRSREATVRALSPLGIKPYHYGVLVVLEAVGPLPQQAVGRVLEIDKSTMTVVVDHLERTGLVERQRNPMNRRAYELMLTDAGRQVLAAAQPIVTKVDEEVLAPLDAGERTQLHALLLKLLPGSGEGHDFR